MTASACTIAGDAAQIERELLRVELSKFSYGALRAMADMGGPLTQLAQEEIRRRDTPLSEQRDYGTCNA